MDGEYRVVRDDFGPEPIYSIHHVYYDQDGNPKRRTFHGITPSAGSLEELTKELAEERHGRMLDFLSAEDQALIRQLLAEQREALGKPVLADVPLGND